MTDHWRGHAMVEHAGRWLYVDTGTPVAAEPDRSCGRCGQANTPEGHDACLGTLPGMLNACCGHGSDDEAYVQFVDGRRLAGAAALAVVHELQQGNENI